MEKILSFICQFHCTNYLENLHPLYKFHSILCNQNFLFSNFYLSPHHRSSHYLHGNYSSSNSKFNHSLTVQLNPSHLQKYMTLFHLFLLFCDLIPVLKNILIIFDFTWSYSTCGSGGSWTGKEENFSFCLSIKGYPVQNYWKSSYFEELHCQPARYLC